jgi:hypothetical protein
MTVTLTRPAIRLDVELAVALELASQQLVRASCPEQLDRAVTFNLRLWRVIRGMVGLRPTLSDRQALMDTADHIATMLVVDASPACDSRDISFVAARNAGLAGDLASPTAIHRAFSELLNGWVDGERLNQTRPGPGPGGKDFECWLLERISAVSDTGQG